MQRLGIGLLVALLLVITVAIVHVTVLSNRLIHALELSSHHSQQRPQTSHTAWVQRESSNGPLSSTSFFRPDTSSHTARVLVVYANNTHLNQLARAVECGVREVLVNAETQLRVRIVKIATFEEDVLWADAVILGSHVNYANVEPKIVSFLNTWSLSQDLSHKIGAVFVTGGGLSAGEELTMVNLLHSLIIFRMMIVGGERWTSPFGASAIVSEGPFQPYSAVTEQTPTLSDQCGANSTSFPAECYAINSDQVNTLFLEKAIGLGRRVASLATVLKRGFLASHP